VAGSSAFPAFITDTYRAGTGFAEFERSAAASSDRVRKRFESDFKEVGRVIGSAVKSGIEGGKLDLNVGEFRQAAAEAKLYGEALRATLRTAQALATETRDTSEATRGYLNALSAQAKEAEHAEAVAQTQVATYTRLQTALDITAAKNSRLASTYREIYAEQAKAARAEVAARDRQFAANSGYAPGLVRQGKSASQSGSVFEAAFARDEADRRVRDPGIGHRPLRRRRGGKKCGRSRDASDRRGQRGMGKHRAHGCGSAVR
jgi:hypothetical protein